MRLCKSIQRKLWMVFRGNAVETFKREMEKADRQELLDYTKLLLQDMVADGSLVITEDPDGKPLYSLSERSLEIMKCKEELLRTHEAPR